MATAYHSYRDGIYRKKKDSLSGELPACAKEFLTMEDGQYMPSTLARYAVDLLLFFQYVCESVLSTPKSVLNLTPEDLGTVTALNIMQYVGRVSEYKINGITHQSGISRKKAKLSAIRAFYRFLYTHGDLKTNPASLCKLPKAPKKVVTALDRKDQSDLVATVTKGTSFTDKEYRRRAKLHARDKAILYVLLGTGLRVSELVGLDLGDVDLDKRRLSVIRKGGSEDYVFFNEEVREALTDYIYNGRPLLKPNKASADALWISQKHSRINVSHVNDILKVYAKKLEIKEKVSAHLFRRTFASSALAAGTPLTSIQAALGHAQLETTASYYLKRTDDAKIEAAQRVQISDAT